MLDAKQQLRDGRRQAAMLAVVERAKLGADAKEPRGAGFKPMVSRVPMWISECTCVKSKIFAASSWLRAVHVVRRRG